MVLHLTLKGVYDVQLYMLYAVKSVQCKHAQLSRVRVTSHFDHALSYKYCS